MGKILVFVVAYQAEKFIIEVFDRIAAQIREEHEYELLMIDDASTDRTFELARAYADQHPQLKITNLYNPTNQGYGGNQQIGYQYAVENHFDAVVLLHGDGQYPPELLNELAEPILKNQFDVMLGSRMVNKKDALAGGMPFYKWVGNQILTWIENKLIGQRLSEYHTGFRAYSIKSLSSVPFISNSKYYDFDTDILIQMADNDFRIGEIPIPTRYGDEICRVNGFKYGMKIVWSCVQSRVMRLGLFYNPKFDYSKNPDRPQIPESKLGSKSSHQLALDVLQSGDQALDLGAGSGFMACALSQKGVVVHSVDKIISDELRKYSQTAIEVDLDMDDFSGFPEEINAILLLDILEQLNSAENLLLKIREKYAPQLPKIYISVGNVAFFITRFSLFFGKFNYGNAGILEMKKKRLFTQKSLIRMLKDNGYKVKSIEGIPAPYQKAIGNTWFARFLQTINAGLIHLSKGLFSYQLFVSAEPTLTVEQLLANAKKRK